MLHELDTVVSHRPPAAAEPSPETREALAWRIPLYRLLSGAFLEEPTSSFLDALRQPDSLQCLAEAGLRFDADFLAADTTHLADQLAVEYASLFAASGGLPPVESVRLTGRLKQDPYFDVAASYRRYGFRVGGTRFYVFEDQLGVELAFVAELLERCCAALDDDDEAQYRRLEKEIKRFWTTHLGKWVRGYARIVQRAAEHSYYREMARLLEAFATEEIALLCLRIADEEPGRVVVPKSEIQTAFNPDEPVCAACKSGQQSALAGLESGHAG